MAGSGFPDSISISDYYDTRKLGSGRHTELPGM